MRKRNTELLGEVVKQFLKKNKLDNKLHEKHLLDAWPKVLGQNINQYTTELIIKKSVLYVSLSSSVLRHDLFLSKSAIVKALNNEIGVELLNDIIFK